MCLLFGLVAVNANELADSAEKRASFLFSSRQGDLHYWKNRK